MKSKKLFMAVAASIALHAAVPEVAVRMKDVAPKFKDLIEKVDSEIDKMKMERVRKKFIAKARKDIKNGEFNLGKFILDAERIDAEEKGEEYRYEEAQEKLNKKIAELQDLLEKDHSVQEAVPMILTEFNYYGFSMGSTGDAIIENGGNCEAISHYIASIVYDAGHEENIYFRRYGADESGSGHIAPIFVDKNVEYDLSAGNYAQVKGVRFRPEKLVDFYAIEHGLEMGEISKDSLVALAKAKGGTKESGSFSYPHTDESFSGGSAPIFSERGVKRFRPTDDKPKQEMSDDEIYDCLDYSSGSAVDLRFNLLNPIPYRVNHLESSSVLVVPMEPKSMDCIMRVIEAETKALEESNDEADRIMHLAKLSGLYLDVYRQLSIMGKITPAEKAFEHRKEIEEKAKKIFEKIEEKEQFAGQLTKIRNETHQWGFELWHLIFLGEAGVDFLFDLMQPGIKYEKGVYGELDYSLMALRIFPPTRERAEKKMQEWIHTHELDYMGDCDFDGKYDNDPACEGDYYAAITDLPRGYTEPGELVWSLNCGLDGLVYMDFTYELAEDYPPASRLIEHALKKETEPPEFRKLVKIVEKISKDYNYRGCSRDPEFDISCIDDVCKNIIMLEFGVRALFMDEGFGERYFMLIEVLEAFDASEYDAEVKFAKEFKEWLDDVELNDPQARKTAEFMKEHIEKKYSL